MKGYFEDIKPMSTNRRSTPKKPEPLIEEREEIVEEAPVKIVRENKLPPVYSQDEMDIKDSGSGWSKIAGYLGLGLVVILILVYGLSFLFRGATVEVTPKSVAGTVNVTLSATKSGTSGVEYQLMTLPETVTKTITATNTTVDSAKATGSVILYNFQPTSQSLVATTRFADPSGSIFRLQSPVTIPKKTTVGGKDTPGQVVATLVSDTPGIAGNIPLSDFTVVAFSGTAKAKLVYGKGKTAFSGGTSGPAYYLTTDEYTAATTDLSANLAAKLHDESYKQVPEGYILLSDSLTFIPDPQASTQPSPSVSPSITVSYTGKMRGVLLKKTDLEAAYIANVTPQETITPADVTIVGEDALVYQSNANSNPKSVTVPDTISVSVSGDVTLVWNIDQPTIKHVLLGTSRKDFTTAMQAFTSVKEASLILHPFWMNKLPVDTGKIHIEIQNPAAR